MTNINQMESQKHLNVLDSRSAANPITFAEREVLYRFLASIYLYPDSERFYGLKAAAKVLSSDISQSESAFSPAIQKLLLTAAEIDLKQKKELIDEYNRLFYIKPVAPPHETYYLDTGGQLRGWLLSNIQGIYAESGLAISPILNEMPDHISVELEYMSHLYSLAQDENQDVAEDAIANLRAFLDRHLARWFPRFASAVRKAEPRYHYGPAVEATGSVLHSEQLFYCSFE